MFAKITILYVNTFIFYIVLRFFSFLSPAGIEYKEAIFSFNSIKPETQKELDVEAFSQALAHYFLDPDPTPYMNFFGPFLIAE